MVVLMPRLLLSSQLPSFGADTEFDGAEQENVQTKLIRKVFLSFSAPCFNWIRELFMVGYTHFISLNE